MKTKILILFIVVLHNTVAGLVATVIAPGLDPIIRVLTFVGDIAVILLAMLSFQSSPILPARKWMLLLVFASIFTLIYNIDRVDLASHLNGLREPLFFLCVLVVINNIMQSEYAGWFVKAFTIYLIVFALAQLPLSIVQFQEYGAGDKVGGTFGLSGGSGFVSQLLFLIVFYLLVRYGSLDAYNGFSFKYIMLFSLLLIPCALNETKVSFVYLTLFMLFIIDSRRLLRSIPVVLLGVFLLVALNSYYSENVQSTDNLLDPEFFEKYLLHDKREGVDVPRFQKVVMMFEMMADDVWTAIVGMGYGIFQAGGIIGTSRFAQSMYAFSGTRILLNSVWMQGGIIAVILLAVPMFAFLKNQAGRARNTRAFAMFLAGMLLLMWLYNYAILNKVFASIVAFMIVWIEHQHVDIDGPDEVQAINDTDSEIVHEAPAHH